MTDGQARAEQAEQSTALSRIKSAALRRSCRRCAGAVGATVAAGGAADGSVAAASVQSILSGNAFVLADDGSR